MDESLRRKMDENGIIVITSDLDSSTTNEIILSLLNWDSRNPEKELKFYLSSDCMDYNNIITIYDVMQSIKNPISGYAIGLVGGCAVLLLAGCQKGKRFALKSTEISLCELTGFLDSGPNQETEVEILFKEVSTQKDTFEELLSKLTNQNIETIHEDCVKGRSFTAEEAINYGFIDKVLE